ncbi:MAG: FCD domain-containing protein [Rhodocyclaceae bacterium]|nr:FCD domain-containing protein [Rhodocyclaceae bacterium]
MFNRSTAVTRISDAVAAELETRILEGAFKPGDRIPAERELSLELGVSRPSLREAIHKLVSKGMLITRHGGGTFVTDRLTAAFFDPWQEMLRAHPNLQGDLLDFRHMLEGNTGALAAARATDADIERLDAAYQTLCAAFERDDLEASAKADVAFHQTIAEAAHNVLISHVNASLLQVMQGGVSGNLEYINHRPAHWDQLKAQHTEIWTAVRQHDPGRAARAAKEHVDFVRQTISDHSKEIERRNSALRRL